MQPKKKESNAKQLEVLLDPRNGVSHLVEKTVYTTWNNEHYRYFVDVCHHRKIVDEKSFIEKTRDYEQFLIRYIFPTQVERYRRIDEIVAAGAKEVSIEELKHLITTNVETLRYFFDQLDHTWFDTLKENGLLTPSFFSIKYCSRVIDAIPEQALEYILAVSSDILGEESYTNLKPLIIEVLSAANPNERTKILEKIESEDWIGKNEGMGLGYVLSQTLEKSLNDKDYINAQNIVRLALNLKSTEEDSVYSRYPKSSIEENEYKEIVNKLILVPTSELLPFIQILVSILDKFLTQESLKEEARRTIFLREAIEDSNQNHDDNRASGHLISGLRDILKRHLAYCKSEGLNLNKALENILPITLSSEFFERIRLYLYSQFPDDFIPEIEEAILEDYIDAKDGNIELWHEYMVLLSVAFPLLSDTGKENYLAMVESYTTKDTKHGAYDKFRQYANIETHLSEEHRKVYLELMEHFGEPDKRAIQYMIYSSGGRFAQGVDLKDLMDTSEMERLSIEQLLENIVNWSPVDTFMSPSRSDLGNRLKEVIEKRCEYFSNNISSFSPDKVHPTYLFYIFYAFENGLKAGQPIGWSSIIAYIEEYLNKIENNTLPEFPLNTNNLDSGYLETLKAMLRLLEDGMMKLGTIPFHEREKIWSILQKSINISALSSEKDMELLERKNGLYHESINVTYGVAWHAIYRYMFWCDQNLKSENRIPTEVKQVIEISLTENTNYLARSVHGYYFPWLYLYDTEWASKLMPLLFPKTELQKFISAWQTYLYGTVYEEVFVGMKTINEGIATILSNKKCIEEIPEDTVRRSVDYLTLGYIHGFDTEALLLSVIDLKHLKEYKPKVIDFLGRTYLHREYKKPLTPNIKSSLADLWIKRLEVKNPSLKELMEFGWWVKKDFFDNRWMLEQFMKTMTLTEGRVEAVHFLFRELELCADELPSEVADVLLHMLRLKYKPPYYTWTFSEVRSLVQKLYNADKDTKKKASEIIDILIKMGLRDFESILAKK